MIAQRVTVRCDKIFPMPLILASNSPRRRELLKLLGLSFEVLPVETDERPLAGEPPQEYVLRLAEAKARTAAQVHAAPGIYLGADTTVFLDGQVLGKPQDAEEARRMLRQLRGRVHQVFTGLAVFDPERATCQKTYAVTDVPMRAYSDEEIEAYVASGDPLDKAGAYAIQHPWFRPVDALEGCFANVMGLPLCHLVGLLQAAGLRPSAAAPSACQEFLHYRCMVYPLYFPGFEPQ
jgi:septum formation protein